MKNSLEGKFSVLTAMPAPFKVLMGIAFVFFSASVFGLIGYSVASAITGISISEMSKMDFKAHGDNLVAALKISSFFSDIGLFAIPSLLLPWLLFQKNIPAFFGFNKRSPLLLFVLAIALTFCIQPMVDLGSRLNQQLTLPASLRGFESSMKEMQAKVEDLMQHLVGKPTLTSMIVNILFVAVMPAVLEELFFRGLIMKTLQGWLGKPHLAVFITAFVFAAFHGEFYSFIPLFMLGTLLGYAYLWSGDLKLPILIHFTNNLMALLLSYNQQMKASPGMPKPEDAHVSPGLYIGSAVLMLFLLYLYKIKALANNVVVDESNKTEPEQ